MELVTSVRRPTVDYHPSTWGDYFITQASLPSPCQKSEEWMTERVEKLVTEVKEMLRDFEDPLPKMSLIDALQRLGVDYHFEEEISEALLAIHNTPCNSDDLHTTALRFRLLRQHRYNTPSDVFLRFKDDGQGAFSAAALGGDVKGLLSLYEAAYLATSVDQDVLDGAISFTRSQLNCKISHLEPRDARRVLHALETPLHRRMKRLEARHYISIYEEDEDKDDGVLELANLNFHLLQLLHREEIRRLSVWWRELGLSAKLAFARDRLVECYFWILGVYSEPQYSRARMMTTKVIALLSIMDDIYDAYGTLDELELYTDVIQRWSLKEEHQLEDCCRQHFLALDNTIKGFEDELTREGLSIRVYYLKEAIKAAARAWLEEARWRDIERVPSFEDHLNISLMSSGYQAVACASLVGMGIVAKMEAFDWVLSFPTIIKAICKIARLMDDVVSNELETQREHVASAIYCYMKEHGTSIQEACKRLLTMVEDAWKDINEEFLNMVDLPMSILMLILNLARMMETIYKKVDGYTNSSALEDYIALLLVKPISF